MAQSGEVLGEGKRCLVIGPIGNEFAEYGTKDHLHWKNNLQMWEKVFQPVCESFGLETIRADVITESGEIPEQIFTLLRDAEVVIADVSGGNPNVMYELGLRHTIDGLTIQVGEAGSLPFDVASIRTIQFRRTTAGLADLQDRLAAALESGLSGGYRPVSATRIWASADGPEPEATQALARRSAEAAETDDDEDEPGALDLLADGERGAVALNQSVRELGEIIDSMGAAARQGNDEMNEADEQKKGFAGRVLAARATAAALQPLADRMDAVSDEAVQQIRLLDGMVQYLLSLEEEEADQVREFLGQVATMADSAEEGSEGLRGMARSARGMGKAARDLRPVGRQIDLAISRFLAELDSVYAWRQQILSRWPDLGA